MRAIAFRREGIAPMGRSCKDQGLADRRGGSPGLRRHPTRRPPSSRRIAFSSVPGKKKPRNARLSCCSQIARQRFSIGTYARSSGPV